MRLFEYLSFHKPLWIQDLHPPFSDTVLDQGASEDFVLEMFVTLQQSPPVCSS